MSFSFSFPYDGAGSIADAVRTAWTTPRGNVPAPAAGQVEHGTHHEADVAVTAVSNALPHLLAALGPRRAVVDVLVSAHVNPGNVPPPGWSADFLNVTVAVREYTPAPPA